MILTEQDRKCMGCYKERTDFCVPCEIYEGHIYYGMIKFGKKCPWKWFIENAVEKSVLYPEWDPPLVVKAIMENVPRE